MTRDTELRDAFDRGFAAAPPPPAPPHTDFLCLRIGGEPAAVVLAEIASLHADLPIVALPTRAPELLGVAAIRAVIVPIYDLAVAVGATTTGAPRWIVLVRGGAAGFAFEICDGHARAPDRSIATSPAGAARRGHVRGQLAVSDPPRAIIDLGSVLTAIETRWQRTGTAKDA